MIANSNCIPNPIELHLTDFKLTVLMTLDALLSTLDSIEMNDVHSGECVRLTSSRQVYLFVIVIVVVIVVWLLVRQLGWFWFQSL